MNTTFIRVKLDEMDSRLQRIQYEYDKALTVEKERSEVELIFNESSRLLADLEMEEVKLKILDKVIGDEEVAYKKRRMKFIEGGITDRLKYIFPRKNLICDIDCDFKRGQTQLDMYLKDPRGNLRPPFVTEGKGAQQLIAYSAAEGILDLLNEKCVYLDEPFSNMDEINQQKMQNLLGSSVENGFQILLISQSSLIYNDIPRREIYLLSSDGNEVDQVIIKDYQKEE